jgi:hypothetical protein
MVANEGQPTLFQVRRYCRRCVGRPEW